MLVLRHGRALASTFLAALISAPLQAGWGMNDATIVYPLPQSAAEMHQLLEPQDAGPGGALLPLKFWQQIPSLNQGEDTARTYRNLRLVALRLDPCFKFRGDCLPQIRFVWQPIDKATYGSASPFGLEAKDAAVHTFYTLEPDEFRRFVSEYRQLKNSMANVRTDAPLQVHPLMLKQGLGGPFSQGLRELLLKYCGERNLWRVTSMSTLVGGDKWEFRGFNIVAGKPLEIVIPRTGNARSQSFFVSLASDREYRNGRISPTPLGEDNLNLMLRDSRSITTRDVDKLKGLGAAVARIENPAIHSPETMDCVSCHSTQVAGALLFGSAPWLSRDPQIMSQAFRSSSPLLQSVATTRNIPRVFRALGYFEKTPVLSRRVINETALVVGQLNKDFPSKLSAAEQAATDRSPLSVQAPSLTRPGVSVEHEKICHGEGDPVVRDL